MKHLSLLLLACLAVFSTGCENTKLSLTVSNRLPNVELLDVIWEGRYIAGGLLPGQIGSFEATCVAGKSEDFPKEGPIEFKMALNGKVVFVKTKEIIKLDCDQQLEFEVNDSTEIEIF
jgi:hypothetical protein